MAITLLAKIPGSQTLSVKDFGARGDGITDDFAAIQACINATPIGGAFRWPFGQYASSAPPVIDKSLTIICDGVATVENTSTAVGGGQGGGNGPGLAPYLLGTVLMPTTPGANGLEITGAGANVHIRGGFGIRFADPIAFLNTGHGVWAQARTLTQGGHDTTLMNSEWDTVMVYGHDGNHYAFYLVNSMLATLRNLRGYGGGGLHFQCDSYRTLTGNAKIIHPYFWMFAGGTAKGYNLVGRDDRAGSSGLLTHLQFDRPQCNRTPVPTYLSARGIPNAITAGMMLWDMYGDVENMLVLMPDLEEGGGSDTPVNFYSAEHNCAVDNRGAFLATDIKYSTLAESYANQPVLTPGTGAGTGATATVDSRSNEESGTITLTTGTSPAAAGTAILTTAYVRSYGGRQMVLTAAASNSGGLGWSATNLGSTTGFQIKATTQLTASTVYKIQYVVKPLYG